jgi:molybdopterin converting factor small subunit
MADRTKTLNLEFFAQFKEDCGLAAETVLTESGTAADLYDELDTKYRFRADKAATRVAVNDILVPWETPLENGDTVVFLAPFGGG